MSPTTQKYNSKKEKENKFDMGLPCACVEPSSVENIQTRSPSRYEQAADHK